MPTGREPSENSVGAIRLNENGLVYEEERQEWIDMAPQNIIIQYGWTEESKPIAQDFKENVLNLIKEITIERNGFSARCQ